MATTALRLSRRAVRPVLDGWRFLGLVIFGICVLMVMGVGADPTRMERHAPAVASFDWVAPGVEGPAGANARYRGFDAAEGSLKSLADHELREALDQSQQDAEQTLALAPAATLFCGDAWLEGRMALGERHGRFTPRAHNATATAALRDTRQKALTNGGKLPVAIIPDDAPDGCAPPAASLRLADFVAPPRLPRLMGYLDAGYFAPS